MNLHNKKTEINEKISKLNEDFLTYYQEISIMDFFKRNKVFSKDYT